MRNSSIHVVRYVGAFQFRDRAQLEHVLTRARACINEQQELAALEGGWLRCFIVSGTRLTVNIAIPALPEHQFAATEVFALLSQHAIDGVVTGAIDGAAVERYVVAPHAV